MILSSYFAKGANIGISINGPNLNHVQRDLQLLVLKAGGGYGSDVDNMGIVVIYDIILALNEQWFP